MKKIFRIVNKCLRIIALTAVRLVLYCIPRASLPRPRKAKSVVLVQFAPRLGFVGGDVVANSLIKKALEEEGLRVELQSIAGGKSRNPACAWLFGDNWRVYEVVRKLAKDRSATIIIDSQLSLGYPSSRCINIFHYSFYGYWRLASYNWSIDQALSSVISSIIQSIGSSRTLNVAVSKFQEKHLRREGVHTDKIIPNCVDLGQFKPDPKVEKTGDFIYVGGYNYYGKGFDVLESLAAKGLNIDCLNDPREGSPLNFLGFVPHAEVSRVLRKYKILLHPSRFETSGMSAIEAMASGLPVIISNVGIGPELKRAIPEFVVVGFGPGTADEYASRSELILRDYNRFSELARAYAENHHGFDRFKRDWSGLITP